MCSWQFSEPGQSSDPGGFSWSGFFALSPPCCSGFPSLRNCCNLSSPGCNEVLCSWAPGTPPSWKHIQVIQSHHPQWLPALALRLPLRRCLHHHHHSPDVISNISRLLYLRSSEYSDGGDPVEAVAAHQVGNVVLDLHLLPRESSALKQLSPGCVVVLGDMKTFVCIYGSRSGVDTPETPSPCWRRRCSDWLTCLTARTDEMWSAWAHHLS